MICDVCEKPAESTVFEKINTVKGPMVFKQVLCPKCLKSATRDAKKKGRTLYFDLDEAEGAVAL